MSVLHVDDLLLGPGDGLIVTDLQNDFLPGGSLAVEQGDQVIAPLNRAILAFARRALPIFATRDWHPPHHISFHERGGPWPPHCIQGTWGALFSSRLELPPDAIVISKAYDPDHEAYSSFQGTPLLDELKRRGVRHLFIGGLTTEYCVLESVRDALTVGICVSLLVDAVKGIDVHPGDADRAIHRMFELGASPVSAGRHGEEPAHVPTP